MRQNREKLAKSKRREVSIDALEDKQKGVEKKTKKAKAAAEKAAKTKAGPKYKPFLFPSYEELRPRFFFLVFRA